MLSDGENAYVDDGSPQRSGGGKGSLVLTLLVLGILFLPSFIMGYLTFSLIRHLKLKPQLITLIALLAIGTMALWWNLNDYTQQIIDYFVFADNWQALFELQSWSLLIDNWTYLVGPALIGYFLLGVIGGWFSAMFQARVIRRRPEMKEFQGHWMYKFKYRKTPLEVWRKRQRIKGLKSGRFREEGKAPLGIDVDDDSLVSRYDSEAVQHLLITGGTGTGKSISMLSLIKKDIEYGLPIIVVDLKRSPDLASKLSKWTHENKGDFYHFVNGDPENYDIPYSPGQAYYDPLKAGSNTSKQDMVLGMREYDQASAVYKSSMQRVLTVIFNLTSVVRKLREQGRTELCENIDWNSGGIYLLSSAAKTDNFIELLNTCANLENKKISGMATEVLAEINKRGSNGAHALSELQGQMQTLVASDYGDWLQTAEGERSIDLFTASKTPGNVILFSLNSDDEKEFSRFMGSIIMADITRTSALRRNADAQNPVHIYIDEFQVLIPDNVTDLLEKARASAMGVTLAQQSLSQVMKSVAGGGEAYLESILDTCSSFIFHAGSGFDTAERMAKIVGKHSVEKYSINKRQDRYFFSINWKNDREALASTRLEEEWIIDPSKFMRLSSPTKSNHYKSTAIIIKKASADPRYKNEEGSTVRETWMIPEQEILDKHYNPTNAETKKIYDERHAELEDEELAEIAALSSGEIVVDDDFEDGFEINNDYSNPFIEDTGSRSSAIRSASQRVKRRPPVKNEFEGFQEIENPDSDEFEDDWSLEDLKDLAEYEEEVPVQKPKRKKAPKATPKAKPKSVPVPKERIPKRSNENPKPKKKPSSGLPIPGNTKKPDDNSGSTGGLPTMPKF